MVTTARLLPLLTPPGAHILPPEERRTAREVETVPPEEAHKPIHKSVRE